MIINLSVFTFSICYLSKLTVQSQICVPLLMLDQWLVETQQTLTNVVMVEEDGKVKVRNLRGGGLRLE